MIKIPADACLRISVLVFTGLAPLEHASGKDCYGRRGIIKRIGQDTGAINGSYEAVEFDL